MGILEAVVSSIVGAVAALQGSEGIPPEVAAKMKQMSFYGFSANDIDGKEVSMKAFQGKVVMVVNVASKCGLTPQYATLQALYERYKDRGLVVLGFPANEFRGQEPGSNAEIKEFCTRNYSVTFPMFEKIVVKGPGIHPIYQWLLSQTDPSQDIDWNFAKFVVSRDGKHVTRFNSRVKPDSPEVIAEIESELGK